MTNKTVVENANGWSPALETVIKTAAAKAENGVLTNDLCKQLAKDPQMVKAGKALTHIRGKAISSGVYQKAATTAKPVGQETSRKADYVRSLETLVSMPVNSLDTAEKMSKPQLIALSEALIKISDQREANKA